MEHAFDFDASPGYLLGRAHSSMKTAFNRVIKENGIDATPEQWGLLNIIKASPGIIQSEIAGRSMKDKTNVTRMLDVLERNGHIERKGDDKDRRSYRVFITGKGKSLLKRLVPIAAGMNEKALSGMTAKERKILIDLLDTIFNNTREG